ncbi:carbohydrate ABC transporter permease [Tepidanaerobacter acetatoxydans]|jgi:sn-glycerol 3-phosphate transport system permease protein|uniref:carbohydrate ABC transporter permease n=1 Tax=Tepidanaerobacter acetatoxydans TaxID=499229 RepID=UPI001BD57C06|nr:carbohydrate ABC transporter permease [Tepidanaerobacter acetatoxydans]
MKIKVNEAIWHILMWVIVIFLLIPIVFAISNSFKTISDSMNNAFNLIPKEFTLENYKYVFERLPFFKIVVNTFIIAFVVTAFKLLTSIFAAYSLVFFDFKCKNFIYYLLISTMFIPFTVTMIPNYITISAMGFRDSIIGVILPQLADALGIFLIRQSMRTIPKSLIEYAYLENIRNIKIMRDIVIPLIKPAIVSTGIIFFINSWNEYVWPVLILKSKRNYTLSLALQMFISSEGGTEFTIAMAVSVLTMVVPLCLYIIFQKYIINTFSLSGIKG